MAHDKNIDVAREAIERGVSAMTKKSANTTSKTLSLPPSTPRNPIAANPLLKKSGAHADRRTQAALDHAKGEIEQIKKVRRKNEESNT
jgi:hypothetical protein